MKFKSRFQVDGEVPTSSMADIAFLLIIFFMVTTVFAARKGLNMEVPKPDPADPVAENEQAIYVMIHPGGRFVVDRQDMDLGQIRGYVNDKISINPNKFVILHPHDEAEFGYIIDALDEVRQSGAQNISVPSREEIRAWQGIPGYEGF